MDWLPPHRLGLLVSGSLSEGLAARLDTATPIEDVRLGKFIKVSGQKFDFFCLITDVQLDAANPDVLRVPPGAETDQDVFLRQVLDGTSTFGTLKLKPELMLGSSGSEDPAAAAPRPARTVPPHFAPVFEATADDFERVFGREDGRHFQIGQPIDMDVPICLDLEKLVQRSNGVFGKSGSGKSFLTRLILAGIIKSKRAVNLVFDMHSEYGWSARDESKGQPPVKGLSQLFGRRVAVFTLGAQRGTAAGHRSDGQIKIALQEIGFEDIALLQDELKLHRTAVESATVCEDELGPQWVSRLLEMDRADLKEFAAQTGANHASLSALRNKLRRIERLPFVVRDLPRSALEELIACLESGRHVVLEFGNEDLLLAYILAANVITRRLHNRWVEKSQKYDASGRPEDEPPQLMITVEEAHKFLGSEAAHQTTFGTIARELRKFHVTLLVVDQRPSSIDSEVLSQIGTRLVAQLNDERDIDAVFTGMSGGSHLRSVLATLDSSEQALVLGHAVPMPVMIQSRKYDAAFYAAVQDPLAMATPAGRRQTADLYDVIVGRDD